MRDEARRAEIEIPISADLIDRFAAFSGDDNPLHMRAEYARSRGFRDRVAHGAISVAFISRIVGTILPGSGALWRSLHLDWIAPLFPGDTLRLSAVVEHVSTSTESLRLTLVGTNQGGAQVLRAAATVGVSAELATTLGRVETPEAPAAKTTAADAERLAPIIVTGGGRGIGRAIALTLARRGHPIALTYKSDAASAVNTVEEIAAMGGSAAALPFDAGQPEGAAQLVLASANAVGTPLGLVHSGSPPLRYVAAEETSLAELETLQRIYVGSALALSQALLPACRDARFGRLVFIGSSALIGAPPLLCAAYVAAKMGLVGLTRALAVEWGRHGVTCNLVSPGLTDTSLVGDLSQRAKLLEAQRTPLKRLAAPEDVAALVTFLISQEGGFATGCHIPVNGGVAMF